MDKVCIRTFSPSDLNRVLEIENVSFTLDAFSKRTFESWYRKSPDLFFVAEVEGRIVGYMITCIISDKGVIASIAVEPMSRHKGFGKALARFTFDQLIFRKLKIVDLDVRGTNLEGIRFWERLGFFQIGTIPNFYGNGADAIRMRKRLHQDGVELIIEQKIAKWLYRARAWLFRK